MRMAVCAIAVVLGVIGPGLVACATQKPRPIEFWFSGDDGLSRGFQGAVAQAIKASGTFEETNGGKGTLTFFAPTNVLARQEGDRTEVEYQFEFQTADRKTTLDRMQGVCWADEMNKCAAAIIERAKAVAARY